MKMAVKEWMRKYVKRRRKGGGMNGMMDTD